jgi:hypothetical protein
MDDRERERAILHKLHELQGQLWQHHILQIEALRQANDARTKSHETVFELLKLVEELRKS